VMAVCDDSVLKHACAHCLNNRNDTNLREPAVNQFRKVNRIMHSYMYRSYQGSNAPGHGARLDSDA